MRYIILLKKLREKDMVYAGGKAESLSRLMKEGFLVPQGFVLLSCAFNENGEILKEAKDELEYVINNKLNEENTYAVRSSAIGEDGINASFAGAYDTYLDVKKEDVFDSGLKVRKSSNNNRVNKYSYEKNVVGGKVAVIIQKYINPDFAGVLFTSDIITGSSAKMNGNYVKGACETLVSGNSNAIEFSYDTIKNKYIGNNEFKKYSKKLYKSAVKIKELYGCPQDIEWLVSNEKVYIVQSRPITTLKRYNYKTYNINGSLAGEYLFSKTNIGEIFMKPLSPATYGILENICNMLGVPCFIDNIYGQAYCNISVICSLLVAFKIPKNKAYSIVSDIAGKLPEGIDIPIFPFDKKQFIKSIGKVIFSKKPKSKIKMSNKEFSENIADIADKLINKIRVIDNNNELFNFWVEECDEFMNKTMGVIMTKMSLKTLLKTRKEIINVAGEELGNILCSNCSLNGTIESIRPLLAIEDILLGKITKEEYVKRYGHRSENEMELSCPYNYENPNYPNNLIKEYKKSKIDLYKMKENQEKEYNKALLKFKKKYPKKAKWIDKTLHHYSIATYKRENVRSQAVKLFCLMREFLLKAAKLNNLGNDIFMLYFTETMEMLKGNKKVLEYIPKRKENYNKYINMPKFPNIILGRFIPEDWLKDENRRTDYYKFGEENNLKGVSVIKGYKGAAGVREGIVHVIKDLNEIETFKEGEILVTNATNIGWITIFPKAKAIVTDIGAPLSHAAIVAREFGIPAVVGCMNATSILKDGDLVKVDGTNGTVIKI